MKQVRKQKMRRRIYLDYAASTPVAARVYRVMKPYFSNFFGNPLALHAEGRMGKEAIETARIKIAKILSVRASEILFISGGTEANNLALIGSIEAIRKQYKKEYRDLHIITTPIEHSSVLECMYVLEGRGVEVSYLPVSEAGIVDAGALQKLLRDTTVLVSVCYVNNEIGTIQPLVEISASIRDTLSKKRALPLLFHTGASQAPLFLSCSPRGLGVQLMTLDAQKIYGPKGVGVLYCANGTTLAPILHGAVQEKGLRPGTENVPLIVGCAEALCIAHSERKNFSARMRELQDYFLTVLAVHVPEAFLNGDRRARIPSNINVSFPGVDGEFLVVSLDMKGIASTTRSACGEGKKEGSPVIRALGKGEDFSTSAVRFTLGKGTTKKELLQVAHTLRALLDARRAFNTFDKPSSNTSRSKIDRK